MLLYTYVSLTSLIAIPEAFVDHRPTVSVPDTRSSQS